MTTTLNPISSATGPTCSVGGVPVLDELTRDEVTAALYASPFEPGDLDRRGLDVCETFVMQAVIELGTDAIAADANTVAVLYSLDAATLDALDYPAARNTDLARLDACHQAAAVIVTVRT